MTEGFVFSRNVCFRPYLLFKPDLMITVPDGAPIVPYTIWGNNLKVVLRTNAELKYHDVTPHSRPVEVVKTQWVNYIFADETGMRIDCRPMNSSLSLVQARLSSKV